MYYKRRQSDLQKRNKLLNWTLSILEKLALRNRTKELIFFLMDGLLLRGIVTAHSELFCVSCILFVVKLEADFTANLANLNEYILNKLKITHKTLLLQESLIVQNLPPNFALLPTFSDLNPPIVKLLASYIERDPSLVRALNTTCIKFYVNNVTEADSIALSVSALFSCSRPKAKQTEILEFLSYLIEENLEIKKPVRLAIVETLLPIVSSVALKLQLSSSPVVSPTG